MHRASSSAAVPLPAAYMVILHVCLCKQWQQAVHEFTTALKFVLSGGEAEAAVLNQRSTALCRLALCCVCVLPEKPHFFLEAASCSAHCVNATKLSYVQGSRGHVALL
jgi:hypothetical protein